MRRAIVAALLMFPPLISDERAFAYEPASLPVHIVDASTLRGTTVWSSDRVHRITGVVRIADGGVLRVLPGTRIEGLSGAAIVVARSGRIEVTGTQLQPVVLSCAAGTMEVRDCWGGLIIAGNAPVNGGLLNSPAARGVGAAGCAERTDDALAGPFGGCDLEDNSGVLRYVRVQNGTRGLQLLGVGRGTQIEFVQVHAAGAGGITLRGGTVDVRHLLITSSGPTGIAWRGGWTGRLQHAIVQMPAEGGTAVEGSNDQASPSLAPRSSPELFNLSLVRLPADGAPSSTGLRLRDGTAATVRNVLLAGFDVTLDIDGAESCSLVDTQLSVRHGVLATTGLIGDPDADGACAGGAATEDLHLSDATLTRVSDPAAIDGLQKAGFSATLADFRTTSPLFLAAAILPPDNGFFLPSAYVGAVEREIIQGANVPWHAGWTVGGLVENVNAFGSVAGTVTSATRGALNGARVEAGGVSTLTGADGSYTIAGVLAGASSVSLTTAPTGCTLPVAAGVAVSAGLTSTLDIAVDCAPPVITTAGMVLTYMCGKTFRVRNPNDAVVTVEWNTAGSGESGSLILPARPMGSGFSETFFDTVGIATVRLLYNGALVQTKANGNFPCVP